MVSVLDGVELPMPTLPFHVTKSLPVVPLTSNVLVAISDVVVGTHCVEIIYRCITISTASLVL